MRLPSPSLIGRPSQLPQVEARAAVKGGQVQVDVDKPLGLVLDQSKSPKGGLVGASSDDLHNALAWPWLDQAGSGRLTG